MPSYVLRQPLGVVRDMSFRRTRPRHQGVLTDCRTEPPRACTSGGAARRTGNRTGHEWIGRTRLGNKVAGRSNSLPLSDENSRAKVQNVCGDSSAVVLDGNRFRNQTDGFQRLLQRASQSFGAEGENADRNIGIEGRQSSIVPLAATLSWALSHTDRGVRRNSPGSGSPRRLLFLNAGCVDYPNVRSRKHILVEKQLHQSKRPFQNKDIDLSKR